MPELSDLLKELGADADPDGVTFHLESDTLALKSVFGGTVNGAATAQIFSPQAMGFTEPSELAAIGPLWIASLETADQLKSAIKDAHDRVKKRLDKDLHSLAQLGVKGEIDSAKPRAIARTLVRDVEVLLVVDSHGAVETEVIDGTEIPRTKRVVMKKFHRQSPDDVIEAIDLHVARQLGLNFDDPSEISRPNIAPRPRRGGDLDDLEIDIDGPDEDDDVTEAVSIPSALMNQVRDGFSDEEQTAYNTPSASLMAKAAPDGISEEEREAIASVIEDDLDSDEEELVISDEDDDDDEEEVAPTVQMEALKSPSPPMDDRFQALSASDEETLTAPDIPANKLKHHKLGEKRGKNGPPIPADREDDVNWIEKRLREIDETADKLEKEVMALRSEATVLKARLHSLASQEAVPIEDDEKPVTTAVHRRGAKGDADSSQDNGAKPIALGAGPIALGTGDEDDADSDGDDVSMEMPTVQVRSSQGAAKDESDSEPSDSPDKDKAASKSLSDHAPISQASGEGGETVGPTKIAPMAFSDDKAAGEGQDALQICLVIADVKATKRLQKQLEPKGIKVLPKGKLSSFSEDELNDAQAVVWVRPPKGEEPLQQIKDFTDLYPYPPLLVLSSSSSFEKAQGVAKWAKLGRSAREVAEQILDGVTELSG